MSLTQFITTPYTDMLQAMSGWLTKAETQLSPTEAEALLGARLAPDMFPLSTQIRFACTQAQEAVHRLQDSPFPPSMAALRDEALNAGETPGTIADANAWIDQTVALLAGISAQTDPSKPIAHELPNGMIFDLTAEEYVRDWSLGQFYFHLMIAYAILRSNGVALGKIDYIPHMVTRLRPETMPQG